LSFTPERLLAILQSYPSPPGFRVALSGGLDSSVLLYAVHELGARLGASISAVHVDHGLQPESTEWAEHCRQLCHALEVPLEIRSVIVDQGSGEGLEAAARNARHRLFAELLEPGERLLTAHHRDDQAETLLLQLLRGAGVRGLAAMPARRELGAGWLERPLLGFDRSEIERYAVDRGLSWVEDPSNRQLDFDRNFLRLEILPRLRERWPGTGRTIARSARHCGRAVEAIDALALQDLAQCRAEAAHRLQIAPLSDLPRHRQRELLRTWIRGNRYPVPDESRVERVLSEVLGARADASPLVSWSGAEVRRFRDQLWLLPPLPEHDPEQVLRWRTPDRLILPDGLGELRLLNPAQHLLSRHCREGRVTVRFRSTGERCRRTEAAGSKTLKNLYQERAVPPWLRDRVPLVFLDQELVAVADYSNCSTAELSDREFTLFWSLQEPWR
jgi:tRNA(Ile)-lysidine synthase